MERRERERKLPVKHPHSIQDKLNPKSLSKKFFVILNNGRQVLNVTCKYQSNNYKQLEILIIDNSTLQHNVQMK